MAFSFFGTSVSSGIAIGRAVVLASSSHEIDHYFITPDQKEKEFQRLYDAQQTVLNELQQLQQQLPPETPTEIGAILEVHIMMLNDRTLAEDLIRWIDERLYNAEWALDTQLKLMLQQFDKMDDDYLRERGADLSQIVERMQRALAQQKAQQPVSMIAELAHQSSEPLVIVANDITPADMLHFNQKVFRGFVTDIGGKTSHSAIIARSLEIPALVGTRHATQLIEQDDLLIVDSENSTVIVNPSNSVLEEYQLRQRQHFLERERLNLLRKTPAVTLDEQAIELLANIEMPADVQKAKKMGAMGIGLFRSEFLFMSHTGGYRKLPDEEEQYQAYKTALEGMPDHVMVIRTIDIGADKPLSADDSKKTLNPALGLRAIRWSLSDPDVFMVQLRALLRASVHGQLSILIPMLTHEWQIKQTLQLIEKAKLSLSKQGIAYRDVRIGAMIEVPAAVLILPVFLRYFDFLSIGTNDLIQYTLAIDRADETVSDLFDPLHPAVLQLIAKSIEACNDAGKRICVCGEMAGDPTMTRLLLGLGLKSFSMHPSQLLTVKSVLLHCNVSHLQSLAWAVVQATSDEERANALEALQNA